MRRLPVYLLLDSSESMIGGGIQSVERGVEQMLQALRTDPHALETVWMSCITFDNEARLVFPLTELTEVQMPKLSVRPGTALGGALSLCADRIKQEVRRTSAVQRGDWRPLVILLTDGQATDNWAAGLARLGQNVKPRPANIYAIGCGDDVDVASLRELTDIVLHLEEMTAESLSKLFIWLTASVAENSRGLNETEIGPGLKLDNLPASLKLAKHNLPPKDDLPRQVFLFARCARNREPYLMRYRRSTHDSQIFQPVVSHKMNQEGIASRDSFGLPPVQSDLLDGAPPCPYCQAAGAGCCGTCGTLFCQVPSEFDNIVCPSCQNSLTRRSPNQRQKAFAIRQSLA